MAGITDILDASWVYRLWQSPFAGQKLAPVLRHNALTRTTRVLDVGCGPGTNTPYFAHADYLGIDLNSNYIASAQRRHGREFIAADVRAYLPEDERGFDFILANSFFHHIDDENTRRILSRLHDLLAPDGQIHILDLVLPAGRSISRWLARHDRGEYPRELDHWRNIFCRTFEPIVFEPYAVKTCGVALWEMVYFNGKCKASKP